MCSLFLKRPLIPLLGAFLLTPGAVGQDDCCGDESTPKTERNPKILRISADPNNLPFSNQRLEGFENKLAEMLAQELGVKIEWHWRAQRRGFFRETLKAKATDLVMGVPKGFEMALTTAPYYRSTYAFVTRKDRKLDIKSLDDPRLRELRIGVQLVGDDGSNPPAAHAFARRGIINNLRGYTLYGDYREENPPARIVRAVADGEVDVALVWGPLAGYFAAKQAIPLEITALAEESDSGGQRFAFSIAMGVQKGDQDTKDRVDQALLRRREDVERILDEFGILRIPLPGTPSRKDAVPSSGENRQPEAR